MKPISYFKKRLKVLCKPNPRTKAVDPYEKFLRKKQVFILLFYKTIVIYFSLLQKTLMKAMSYKATKRIKQLALPSTKYLLDYVDSFSTFDDPFEVKRSALSYKGRYINFNMILMLNTLREFCHLPVTLIFFALEPV